MTVMTTSESQSSEVVSTKYQDLAKRIGQIVDDKNRHYGNSFAQAGDFLRLLYPQGIKPEQYDDMLCIVRIFDKIKRIATSKNAYGESPFADLVGYGLLGLAMAEEEKTGPELLEKEKEILLEKLEDIARKQEDMIAADAKKSFEKFKLTEPIKYAEPVLHKELEKTIGVDIL